MRSGVQLRVAHSSQRFEFLAHAHHIDSRSMPARLSSMELSPDSNPDAEQSARPSRRKSGRAVHAPERLVASSAPTKRKRDEIEDFDDEGDEDDVDMGADGEEDEQDEDDGDDEAAAEEVRDRKRKTRRTTSTGATASKKAKTKSTKVKPATRPKVKARTVKKGAQIDSAEEVGGLYGKPRITTHQLRSIEADSALAEVFGEGKSLDDVTAQWLTRFNEHETNALTEVVNLLLRATGSTRQVEPFDIDDPDNCQNRLQEIQEELQAVCGAKFSVMVTR